VPLRVEYAGAEPIPRGGFAGQGYLRSEKVVSVSFKYYVPLPEVQPTP